MTLNTVLTNKEGTPLAPATTAEQVSYDGTRNVKQAIEGSIEFVYQTDIDEICTIDTAESAANTVDVSTAAQDEDNVIAKEVEGDE